MLATVKSVDDFRRVEQHWPLRTSQAWNATLPRPRSDCFNAHANQRGDGSRIHELVHLPSPFEQEKKFNNGGTVAASNERVVGEKVDNGGERAR